MSVVSKEHAPSTKKRFMRECGAISEAIKHQQNLHIDARPGSGARAAVQNLCAKMEKRVVICGGNTVKASMKQVCNGSWDRAEVIVFEKAEMIQPETISLLRKYFAENPHQQYITIGHSVEPVRRIGVNESCVPLYFSRKEAVMSACHPEWQPEPDKATLQAAVTRFSALLKEATAKKIIPLTAATGETAERLRRLAEYKPIQIAAMYVIENFPLPHRQCLIDLLQQAGLPIEASDRKKSEGRTK